MKQERSSFYDIKQCYSEMVKHRLKIEPGWVGGVQKYYNLDPVTFEWSLTDRGCNQEKFDDGCNHDDLHYCYCNTDLCNSNNGVKKTLFLFMLFVIGLNIALV